MPLRPTQAWPLRPHPADDRNQLILRGFLRHGAALAIAGGLAASAAGPVSADVIAFTRIADQHTLVDGGTGTFSGFRTTFNTWQKVPTIDGGEVVFVGYGNGVLLPPFRYVKQTGIYAGIGDVVRKIVDIYTSVPACGGDFLTFFPPSKAGDYVAFRAVTSEGAAGVFRVHDGEVTALACAGPGGTEPPDYPGATFMTFGEPSVDAHGTVVFRGGTDQDPMYVPQGIYKSLVGVDGLEVVADRSTDGDTAFVGFGGGGNNTKRAAIVDGVTAFLVDEKEVPGISICGSCLDGFAAKHSAIFVDDGEGLQRIIAGREDRDFDGKTVAGVGLPDIDANGAIAFWANTSRDGVLDEAIFRADDGAFTIVADFDTLIPETNLTFAYFGSNGETPGHHNPSIDGGIVVFQGAPDLTLFNVGIYASVDGDLIKVVAPGDNLDGMAVVKTYLGYEAVDGTSIAFMVQLKDHIGRKQFAIYRADLMPVF